jgi:iron(III) transport system substrate-binding protein
MRTWFRPGIWSVVVLLWLFLGGVALGQGSDPLVAAAQKEGTVTWYTVWPQWLVDQVSKAWAAAQPGVKLTVFRSGSSKVAAKVVQERETGRLFGDVVTLTEPSIFAEFKREKILEPYQAPELEAFPARYRDPDGAYATPRVVVVASSRSSTRARRLFPTT